MFKMGNVRNINEAPGSSVAGTVHGVAKEERRLTPSGSIDWVDPFDDDEEIVACGIENPETCEACE